MTPFSTVPFFRVMLPFVAGILFGIQFQIVLQGWIFVSLFGFVLFLFLTKYIHKFKILFLLFVDLYLFVFASNITAAQSNSNNINHYRNFIQTDSLTTFLAVVNELPIQKEKSLKCELKIVELFNELDTIYTNGQIIAYFKHSKNAQQLLPGSTVLIRSRFQHVHEPKNPFEFNYNKFLFNNQVYHTSFIDSSSFVVVETKNLLNPVWLFGLNIKVKILQRLKSSELSNDAYSICAALLTGYDDDIEQSVMDAFAHSGTLHVLSVSGLHTGLIYLVLNYILSIFDRKNRHKIPRFIAITLFLWTFALITGFSAPVLRAVIMFNLLGFGKLFFRNSYRNQLNILLVSAFVMLLYNPWLITNLGFLLSYFALFGLIYFQPGIASIYNPENIFFKSLWTSVSASFAATLSTLPLTLFVFKQFPLWFFVCNIVVVPATFLILLLAVFVVFKINFIAYVVNFIVNLLIKFIGIFNSKNTGYIDGIQVTLLDAIIMSVLIVLFSVAIQKRSYRVTFISLLFLILWQILSLFEIIKIKNETMLTVYNIKKSTAISIKNKTKTDFYCRDSSAYNYSVRPHLISFNYPELNNHHFNFVEYGLEKILVVDSIGHFPDLDSQLVTIIILCNNVKISESKLKETKNLKTVVVDASNKAAMKRYTANLCRKFGLGYYDTSEQGAFIKGL